MDRRILIGLLLGAIVPPVAISLLAGLAALLAGMGDEAGAVGTQRFAVAVALIWALDLIGLVVVLGARAAFEPTPDATWERPLDEELAESEE